MNIRNEFLIKAWTKEERDRRAEDTEKRGMKVTMKGHEYSQIAFRMIYWAKVVRDDGSR